MRTHPCFILLAATLGIILMSCDRRVNPVMSTLSELDKISQMQNEMSLMKGDNSIISFQSDRSGDKEVYVMFPSHRLV